VPKITLQILLWLTLLPQLVWATEWPRAYSSSLKTDIHLQRLDSPGNPYRDEYGQWDRWAYENAGPPLDSFDDAPGSGRLNISLEVDEQGFMLPLLKQLELELKWRRDWGPSPFKALPYTVYAAGEIDLELLERLNAACAEARAPYLSPVPRWLAENPPRWCMLLPDGRVIVEGDYRSPEWPVGNPRDTIPNDARFGWRLLGADGGFLAATPPVSCWWETTIPDFRQRIAGFPHEGLNVQPINGYIRVYGMGSRGTYAQFNWDGAAYPANGTVRNRDANTFAGLYGHCVPLIYAAQQRLQASIALLQARP
jgi:hypothetical protein